VSTPPRDVSSPPPSSQSEAVPASLADRLTLLFERIRKPDGSRYSLREVSDAISEAGEPVSYGYIQKLRTGTTDNPTLRTLRALAQFFRVPVEFFTSNTVLRGVTNDLDLLAAISTVKAHSATLRMTALPNSEEAAQAVTEIFKAIREIERLSATQDDPPARSHTNAPSTRGTPDVNT
jgi:transcriptional regulator with XRE-family HTH domain